MIAPRWKKVLRDIRERPGRSALAVLAMAAGVFEICALTYKYAVLQPVLTTMYGRTHPASATLITDTADDALIEAVLRVPGVADAEARPVVMARVRVGQDEWVPALFSVVRDFDHQRTDTFEPNAGAWPPAEGDVLLERTALSVAKAAIGDTVLVRTPGGDELALRVAGTVHAAGLPPAWMEHFVPGFVPWSSPLRGEDHGESAQIRIVVADHPLDEGYIREVADSVAAMLGRRGHAVTRVNVPTPGRHPHADQMDAFLYLLSGFAILSFVLSAALVASMVHALLAEQIREVGVLKAIGATTRQIAALYLGQVALLAGASLVIGVPLGLLVGRAYAQFSAQILNADITRTPFPFWVVAAVAAAGILVPLAFALWPVYRGSRITVQQALAGDVGSRWFGARRLDRWLLAARGLPRPLMLSMRTTLLRRGRLALAVGMLAMGGGAFISALNVSGAWTRELIEDFGRRRYDLAVGLTEPTPIARLDALLAERPEVERVEYWAEAAPYLIGPSGVAGSTVAMIGPDAGSRLLDLPLLAGQWLTAGDSTGVVINRGIVSRNPNLGVGRRVELRFEGRTVAYPIVGVVKELTPMPAVYAPRSAVLALTNRSGAMARSMRIVTRGHDDAAQRAAARAIERAFQENGIEVRGLQRMLDARQGILDHLVIIFSVLTMASVIIVIVGALGLTSTLTLNVVQRTREIGVLSAIGATPSTISRHVWFEGVAIGVLSWALACVVAAPISAVLESVVGDIFFKAPLDFYLSPLAAAIWLAIVVVVGSASSFYPAWRAARLTVRQALSQA